MNNCVFCGNKQIVEEFRLITPRGKVGLPWAPVCKIHSRRIHQAQVDSAIQMIEYPPPPEINKADIMKTEIRKLSPEKSDNETPGI